MRPGYGGSAPGERHEKRRGDGTGAGDREYAGVAGLLGGEGGGGGDDDGGQRAPGEGVFDAGGRGVGDLERVAARGQSGDVDVLEVVDGAVAGLDLRAEAEAARGDLVERERKVREAGGIGGGGDAAMPDERGGKARRDRSGGNLEKEGARGGRGGAADRRGRPGAGRAELRGGRGGGAAEQRPVGEEDVELAGAMAGVDGLRGRTAPAGELVLGGAGEQQRLDRSRDGRAGERVGRLGEFLREKGGGGGDLRRGEAGERVRRHDVGLDASGAVVGGEAGAVLTVGEADADEVVGLGEEVGEGGGVAVVHPGDADDAGLVHHVVEPRVDGRNGGLGRIGGVEGLNDPAVVLDAARFGVGEGVDPGVGVVDVDHGGAGNEAGADAVEIGADRGGMAGAAGAGAFVDEALAGETAVGGVRQVIVDRVALDGGRLHLGHSRGERRGHAAGEGLKEPGVADLVAPVGAQGGRRHPARNENRGEKAGAMVDEGGHPERGETPQGGVPFRLRKRAERGPLSPGARRAGAWPACGCAGGEPFRRRRGRG